MSDHPNLEAHWGIRKQSVDDCAKHGVELLSRLALIDPSLTQWYRMIGTKGPKDSLRHPVHADLDMIREEFNNYRSRDCDGRIIEHLGYGLRLWNGAEPGGIVVNVHDGAYPSNYPTFPNYCRVELPYDGPASERLLCAEKLREVMTAVVVSLDPDVGRVSSQAMWYAEYPDDYKRPRTVGWLTYISDRYGPLPALPPEYEVIRIDGLGSLIIIIGVDRLTASNPAHVEAVRRLSQILEQAGKLSPSPPSAVG